MMRTILIFIQHLKSTCSIKMYSSGLAANIIKIIKVVFGVVILFKKFMDP